MISCCRRYTQFYGTSEKSAVSLVHDALTSMFFFCQFLDFLICFLGKCTRGEPYCDVITIYINEKIQNKLWSLKENGMLKVIRKQYNLFNLVQKLILRVTIFARTIKNTSTCYNNHLLDWMEYFPSKYSHMLKTRL